MMTRPAPPAACSAPASDVASLLSDQTRDWVAKNGVLIEQRGHLVFVLMPRPTPSLPKLVLGRKGGRQEGMRLTLEILADGCARTCREIAQAMEVGESTARRNLLALWEAGRVSRRAADSCDRPTFAYFRDIGAASAG